MGTFLTSFDTTAERKMTAGRASVRLIRLSGTVCPTDRSLNLQSPNKAGDVVQLVRTLPCHGRGREFESRRPRQLLNNLQRSAVILPQHSTTIMRDRLCRSA